MSDNVPLLDELAWRGLLFQHTDGAGAALGAAPVAGYCGFDPTAPSLHVGNLVPVMGLVHLQRAGNRPVVLVGGGTGMIGDPSGRATERQLNTPETVAANVRGIRVQLERFVDFSGPNAAVIVDNAEWLAPLGVIGFLRDVGKHFSVNVMLAKESVRSRMEHGISYTEFSYMLLQAYDFVELNRRHGVTFQIGGSDQWGNITAGTDLVRRMNGADAHGITFPLMTTASGEKFGKSAGNAVWLDPERTSPYAFYQYWINADDRDAPRFLRTFTLLDRATIEALEAEVAANPAARTAQRELARAVTTMVHGADATRAAEEVSALLFGGGKAAGLSGGALEALRREVPFATVQESEERPGTVDVLDVLVATGLAASRGAAKRLVEQGAVSVNDAKRGMDGRFVPREEAVHGKWFLVRKGKRDVGLAMLEG
jgi:tyrosyl-tRNA synthetase